MEKHIRGLDIQVVTDKQNKYGFNELPDRERKNTLAIIGEILTEPMIFLLVAIVIVYFLLGDKGEAFVLMVSVGAIIGIELYQNSKTEKALEALRNLSSPICNVIRAGEHLTIFSRELVVGDVVMLNEGSRVPADVRLLEGHNIMADESLLTGESLPVDKNHSADDDKSRQLYSGSMVVKGHGIAEVSAIGTDTQIGKIGLSLNSIKPEKTLLQKEIRAVVKRLAVFAVAASVLLTMVFWIMRDDLLRGFLAGLTLSIAILPEEFPVVLTVFMALGAWRLAKNNVLTRKSSTIETLGSATVLCTDKTGTLTENRMRVHSIFDASGQIPAVDDPVYKRIVDYGVLASQPKPFDPMEEAFLESAKGFGVVEDIYEDYEIIKEYPLEETSLSVVHIWGKLGGKQAFVALKGAPEVVFKLCKLSKTQTDRLQKTVHNLASNGLRVLAVAEGEPAHELHKTRDKYSYKLLGLVALADPIRAEAADAMSLCRTAGIRVIMITGDYAETARRIGQEIGLDSKEVLTGEQFGALSPREQYEAVKTVSIFSRVTPANKLTIVGALKHNGEVVAMTGDGVNDAPALKSAHIGIAMGNRGTDVAREASSIVLLDDNFASIIQGIRTGRRIFTNLQKAITYILIVHFPIIILSLMPVLFGWPIVLLPIHIVFLEFIIDPSCTLVFEAEPEEPGAMKKPPRKLHAPLFSKQMVVMSVVTGMVVSIIILAIHGYLMQLGWTEDKQRAMTFLMIALTNVLMISAISGRRAVRSALLAGRITAMSVVLVVVTVALTLVYSTGFIQDLFSFDPLNVTEILIACVVSIVAVACVVPVRALMKESI